jgi:gluconate/galactonate dehydratase
MKPSNGFVRTMKIVAVRTAVVAANFDWTYVRVYAEDGSFGTGEAFMAPALTELIAAYAPLLIGEDPRDVDRLVHKLRWATSYDGGGGFSHHAISGIEAALLDLAGKAAGLPIHRLLGGRFRDRVRIYADCHAGDGLESLGPMLERRSLPWLPAPAEVELGSGLFEATTETEGYEPRAYAARAAAAAELGFTMLKFDLDVAPAYFGDAYLRRLADSQIEKLAALARAACEAVPDGCEVGFDLHWRYDVETAVRLARALGESGAAFLEDPVPPDDLAGLATVRRASPVPISSGENWYTRQGFRRALEFAAIDFAAPDLQKVGGLLEGKRVADLAAAHGVSLLPHCIASPIGLLASAHLCAAVPNAIALEFHALDIPFFDELVADGGRPLIRAGQVELGETPGLGIELDEDAVRRYAKPGEPVFE